MDFLELAESRYSVRSFSDKPIEREKMDKILRAGQVAPTAINSQPQKIYILKSKEALAKAGTLTKSVYGAPVVLMCCVDTSRACNCAAEPGYSTGEMDVSIVCTHMMMEAWDLGIGSVWVRGFNADQAAKTFGLPENIRPVCLLPIGYPAENAAPNAQKHFSRRPLEDTVEEL